MQEKDGFEILKKIIIAALSGCEISLAREDRGVENLSKEEKSLIDLARQHDLLQLLYPATGDKRFRPFFLSAFKFQEMQDYALEEMKQEFERAGISHIPLKGAVLRSLYPKRWMRACSDVDVYVNSEQFEKAESLLVEKLNYKTKRVGSYDTEIIAPNGVIVELHHKLFDNIDFEMKDTDEHFYLYHILHMKKHFEYGGCGIGFLIDLHLLNINAPSSTERRDALLKHYGVKKFEEGMCALARAWFEGEPHPELKTIESYIVSGGKYGNLAQMYSYEKATAGSGVKFYAKKIFVPYRRLCAEFPSLRGKRVLTPAYEVARWIKLVTQKKSGRSVEQREALRKDNDKSFSREEIENIKETLGL